MEGAEIMRIRPLCTCLLFVAAYAPLAAAEVSTVTLKDTLFEVSSGPDGVLMAGRLNMGAYSQNTFADILASIDYTWRDEYDQVPELVVAWDHYLYLTGASSERAELYAPASHAQRVREGTEKGSPRLDPSAAKVELKGYRLRGRIHAGPYSVLLYNRHSKQLNRTVVFPVVLRRFSPQGFRITDELSMGEMDYLGSMAPGLEEGERASRLLTEADVRGLTVFEEAIQLPIEGAEHAAMPVELRSSTKASDDEYGRVYFYCKVQADASRGYGMSVESLAKQAASASKEGGPAQFSGLLWRSMNANSLDELKPMWASYCFQMMERNYDNGLKSAKAGGSADEMRNRRFATRTAMPVYVSGDAWVFASVPSEYGSSYYVLIKGQGDVSKSGRLATVALMKQDDGKTVLSPMLSTKSGQHRPGYITEILRGNEFSRAMGKFVENKYPAVMQRIEAESGPTSLPE